ncbi:hypothetical protein DPMN_096925 [Dreissena polymorpha]|uniref:Uncharacterized protein n=1 Tax=Dreissena polymorpha TaxID=45954 RepID=A0A9D4R489_DREPO|nr:hypothetical protein DPMN_096925 [Dreissena polymorpha]
MLIKAGCTGCWMMPLQAVSNCLSVFAAAGYFNYLRSAYYYLQPMSSLYETHPDEVSLRTQVVSEVGRGYNEVMQNRWALSAPVTTEHTSAMQDCTDLAFNTSPQHKTQLRCTSKEMLLISRKCRQSVTTCSSLNS